MSIQNIPTVIVEDTVKEFFAYCTECKLVLQSKHMMELSEKFLQNLAYLISHGSPEDITLLVNKTLIGPVGLKFKLCTILLDKCYSSPSLLPHPFRREESVYGSIYDPAKLLTAWRRGSMLPDELFCRINRLVLKGEMGSEDAERLSSIVLEEGGHSTLSHPYSPSSLIDLSQDYIQHNLDLCNLITVERLHTRSTDELCILALTGQYVTISAFQRTARYDYSGRSTCQRMSRSFDLWWDHVSDIDQLLFTSSEHRPLLIVGDSIRMHEAVIEVHRVIAVDMMPTADSSPVRHLALLIEGAIIPEAGSFQFESDANKFDNDGTTELGSPSGSHQRGGTNSTSESADDEQSNSIQPIDIEKQFFVVFVVVEDEMMMPVVECVSCLNEFMIHDQVPCSVLYAAPNAAVVYGCHGLLALVRAGADIEASPQIDEVELGRRRPMVFINGPYRFNFAFTSLTTDSGATMKDDLSNATHSSSSTITAIDSNYSMMTTNGTNFTIASGDDCGIVCSWTINRDNCTVYQSHEAFQMNSTAMRIESLQLSPSGRHIVVGYWDRLVLLGLRSECDRQPSLLYVRSFLDIVPDTHSLYRVSFNAESIRVWRVTEQASAPLPSLVPSQPVAGYQSELDSFRYPATAADVARSSSNDDCHQSLSSSNGNSMERSRADSASLSSYYTDVDADMTLESDAPTDRAVIMPLSTASGCVPRPSELHVAGITITSWLHSNVDSVDRRYGSSSRIADRQQSTGSLLEMSDTLDDTRAYVDSVFNDVNSIPSQAGSFGEEASVPSLISMDLDHHLDVADGDSIAGDPRVSDGFIMVGKECIPIYQMSHSVDAYDGGTCTRAHSVDSSFEFNDAPALEIKPIVDIKPLIGEDAAWSMLPGLHHRSRLIPVNSQQHMLFMGCMLKLFGHDGTDKFRSVRSILAVLCACFKPPTLSLISAALDKEVSEVSRCMRSDFLTQFLDFTIEDKKSTVQCKPEYRDMLHWLSGGNSSSSSSTCGSSSSSSCGDRMGKAFWIDSSVGHNLLCSLYLRYCGNKSVAVEHSWQDYLRTYGPTHLRHSSRGLRKLTENIRKIDETANIRVYLPRQIGYISGLYEIYARRVGLHGRIPKELGQLKNLRVLSMGNNHLSGELPSSLGNLKNLQRIVLHQNNLRGLVPPALGELGCIVNLAGNPLLYHGKEVPEWERQALVQLYRSTNGDRWSTRTNWCSNDQPVSKWYKVRSYTPLHKLIPVIYCISLPPPPPHYHHHHHPGGSAHVPCPQHRHVQQSDGGQVTRDNIQADFPEDDRIGYDAR